MNMEVVGVPVAPSQTCLGSESAVVADSHLPEQKRTGEDIAEAVRRSGEGTPQGDSCSPPLVPHEYENQAEIAVAIPEFVQVKEETRHEEENIFEELPDAECDEPFLKEDAMDVDSHPAVLTAPVFPEEPNEVSTPSSVQELPAAVSLKEDAMDVDSHLAVLTVPVFHEEPSVVSTPSHVDTAPQNAEHLGAEVIKIKEELPDENGTPDAFILPDALPVNEENAEQLGAEAIKIKEEPPDENDTPEACILPDALPVNEEEMEKRIKEEANEETGEIMPPFEHVCVEGMKEDKTEEAEEEEDDEAEGDDETDDPMEPAVSARQPYFVLLKESHTLQEENPLNAAGLRPGLNVKNLKARMHLALLKQREPILDPVTAASALEALEAESMGVGGIPSSTSSSGTSSSQRCVKTHHSRFNMDDVSKRRQEIDKVEEKRRKRIAAKKKKTRNGQKNGAETNEEMQIKLATQLWRNKNRIRRRKKKMMEMGEENQESQKKLAVKRKTVRQKVGAETEEECQLKIAERNRIAASNKRKQRKKMKEMEEKKERMRNYQMERIEMARMNAQARRENEMPEERAARLEADRKRQRLRRAKETEKLMQIFEMQRIGERHMAEEEEDEREEEEEEGGGRGGEEEDRRLIRRETEEENNFSSGQISVEVKSG